jgi:hypothetical protein
MKKLSKLLAAAVITAVLALFAVGCDDTVSDTPTPPTPPVTEPNPTVDALIAYYGSNAIDIAYEVRNVYVEFSPGWGFDTPTEGAWSDRLTVLTGIAEGYELAGTLAYTPKVGEEESLEPPYITYTISGKDPATLSPITFTEADAARIAVVIEGKLGGFTSIHADAAEGWAYFDSVTSSVSPYPEAGNAVIKITLAKDDAATAIIGGIVIDSVTIANSSVTAGTYTASYDSASKTLSITIPAEGVSSRGANGIASAAAAIITGKITNSVDGYILIGSASGTISGGNVVANIVLTAPLIETTPITDVISGAADGNITVASGGVSGALISAITAPIANATASATATYSSHAITITFTPAAGYAFNTAEGAYDLVADGQDAVPPYQPPTYGPGSPEITGLKRKIAAITNSVDAAYSVVGDVSYTVTGGNLVFTVALSNYVQAVPITSAINDVVSGAIAINGASVTGDVITALSGAISGATASGSATYSTTTHTVTITLTPVGGYDFNPGLIVSGTTTANPYAAVAAALQTKIGTGITTDDGGYSIVNAAAAEVRDEKLLLTLQMRQDYVAAATITAALSSVGDNSGVTVGSATSVTGSIITALANIASATGAVTTAYSGHAITITIAPPTGLAFNPAGNTYGAVVGTVNTKIGAAVTNSEEALYTVRGATTIAVAGVNLVVTIPLSMPTLEAAPITSAVNGAADGNLTVVNVNSVTGAVITALKNITNTTGAVGTFYNIASHQIQATIAPATGRSFGAAAAYSAVAEAVTAKLESVTNNLESAYMYVRTAAASISAGGSLVITVTLSDEPPVITPPVMTALQIRGYPGYNGEAALLAPADFGVPDVSMADVTAGKLIKLTTEEATSEVMSGTLNDGPNIGVTVEEGAAFRVSKAADSALPTEGDWKSLTPGDFPAYPQLIFANGDTLWIEVSAGQLKQYYKFVVIVSDGPAITALQIGEYPGYGSGKEIALSAFGTPAATMGAVVAGSNITLTTAEATNETMSGTPANGPNICVTIEEAATFRVAKVAGDGEPGEGAWKSPVMGGFGLEYPQLIFADGDVLWIEVSAGSEKQYYKFAITVTP